MQPYLVELKKHDTIINNNYLSSYIIKSENCYLVIVILYDKYVFSANNNI